MHGLGNDFVVIDMWEENLNGEVNHLAEAICHRHFGVGADGLVLIWPSTHADCRMQIYNADGSEAASCGNALRCVAKYLYDNGLTKGSTVTIETMADIYVVEVRPRANKAELLRVNMGTPKIAPGEVTVKTNLATYTGILVDTGVPHLVIFLPSLFGFDLAGEGRQIEQDQQFPDGVNVDFVEMERPDLLLLKVWERGAGATLACGTGATAAAVAAHIRGVAPSIVTVSLPGGPLTIEWDKQSGFVYMLGPATSVFTGVYG